MAPVKMGFVGLGYITYHAHLPPFKEMADAGEVVFQAFCDTDADTANERAREFGANAVYTDHHEMFDKEELDGVYICIPPTLHTDVETVAAEKGIRSARTPARLRSAIYAGRCCTGRRSVPETRSMRGRRV